MEKKKPERMCTVCRAMKPKDGLYKIVKNKDGAFSLDETGKLPGRGAYICKTGDCIEKAEKVRCFERAFKGAFPQELYDALRKQNRSE